MYNVKHIIYNTYILHVLYTTYSFTYTTCIIYQTVQHTTNIIIKLKLATLIESDPKAPFSIANTLWYRGGHYFIGSTCMFELQTFV